MSCHSAAGVMLPVHIPQPRTVHVRVHLRRGDVGMPKEFLHHAEVRAARQQVRGEAVPEHVRMNALESGRRRVPLHDLPHGDSLQRPTGPRQKEPAEVPAIRFGQQRSAIRQVRFDRRRGRSPDGYQSLFAALARDANNAERFVQVRQPHSAHFRRS